MSPERFTNLDHEKSREEILTKFTHLTDQLLEPGVQHSQNWRRAIYSLPTDNLQIFYEGLMNSHIAEHIKEHQQVGRRGQPDNVHISVEDFDSDNTNYLYSRTLEMVLRYNHDTEFEDIRININPRTTNVGSYIFLSEEFETGYEGHQFRSHKLDTNQLQDFYNIVKNSAITLMPEKPIRQQFEDYVLIDEEGNVQLYNPESEDWEIENIE